MKKHLAFCTILLLAFMAACPAAHAAGIDKNFYKKAAERAWGLVSEGIFDPATAIPDSVSAGQSGVIIGYHDDLVADREEQNTMYSRDGRTNRTTLRHIRRMMIKLLDASAIERFSDFEFGRETAYYRFGVALSQTSRTAFGARVHKPDGTVVDVDVNDAVEISDGRKGGKNKIFKLAIPGLEVGDVLEYFNYAEYMDEGGDINNIDLIFCDRYPIVNRLITGRFDPDLTIEFHGYNGAGNPEGGKQKDDNTTRLRLQDVPAVSFDKFLYSQRQLPFLRLNVINNYTTDIHRSQFSSTVRRAGVHYNVPQGRIYNDAVEYISKYAQLLADLTRQFSPLPARALKMTKAWMKNNPDATPRQIADAAQLALMYCNFTARKDEHMTNDMFMAFFHNDVIEKLGIFPPEQTGISFVNSRRQVPTAEIAGWNHSNFMSTAGGIDYEFFNLSHAPGELRGHFQGETGARILGCLRNLSYGTRPQPFVVPDRKYNGNTIVTNLTVDINPDDLSAITVHRDVRLSGSNKVYASDLIGLREWFDTIEDFFAIEPNKRYKIKGYDPEERRAELKDALLDEAEAVMGVRPDSITAYEIGSLGILPGKTDMTYSMDCHIANHVEDLGGDISVTLGDLLGHREAIEGSERERLLDALLPAAYQHTHSLILNIPDGYTVDETSLAALNTLKATKIGLFTVQASMTDDGNLQVRCMTRVKTPNVALADWPALRDIYDAAAAFSSASIILTKN